MGFSSLGDTIAKGASNIGNSIMAEHPIAGGLLDLIGGKKKTDQPVLPGLMLHDNNNVDYSQIGTAPQLNASDLLSSLMARKY